MISSCLKNLLTNNKRIIIPDFGGFIVKRSASGDIISFNDHLKFNDDILVNALVQGEGISKEQAFVLLSNYVKDIVAKLELGERFEIDELGALVKDKKGNIRFIGKAENELVLENKSVSEVPVENAGAEIYNDKFNTNFKNNSDMNGNGEMYGLSGDAAMEEQMQKLIELQNKEKRKKKTRLVIICCIIVFVILLAGLGWMFKDKIFAPNELPVLDESDSVEVVDTIAEPEEVAYAMQPLQRDTIDGISVVADKYISVMNEESYNIIIGSFSYIENAEAFNKLLIKKGLASSVFDRYTGFHAVSCGTYSSLEDALNETGLLLKKYPDLWILVK